jgi:hypothetical protein
MNSVEKIIASFLSQDEIGDIVLFMLVAKLSEQSIPDLFELTTVPYLYECMIAEKVFQTKSVGKFVKNLGRFRIRSYADITNTLPEIFQNSALQRIASFYNMVNVQMIIEDMSPLLIRQPDNTLCVGYMEVT